MWIFFTQLAVEYESNAIIVKVDTDDEYEFARDMQVIAFLFLLTFDITPFPLFLSSATCRTEIFVNRKLVVMSA